MSQPDSSLGGDQAQTPPSPAPGLRVLQVNLRYSHFGFTMLQQFLQSNPIDVILIQDPPQVILSGQGFLPGYNFIISDNFAPSDHSRRPLSAIVLRSSLRFQRLPPVHRRLSGALISTRRGQLAVISAYICHGDGEGTSELLVLVSSAQAHTPSSSLEPIATATAIGGAPRRLPQTQWEPKSKISSSKNAFQWRISGLVHLLSLQRWAFKHG